MSNQDQLPPVVAAFEKWRNNRNGPQVATPEHLRQQAVLLLEHCSSSTITCALRISGTQLKQWRECSTPANTEFAEFVSLLKPQAVAFVKTKRGILRAAKVRFCSD
jgi:hypothetical protein